ncbi:MAG: YqgE/AlgH family protein [Planctomycetaceae bacterium]|jgi:putative transcriptional regulator|nr:YqgE/AlgH family protein [Planctomycetaceae bacterium]
MTPSLQGKLLVATPALEDPNFKQTVVLLIQAAEEGVIGLILNRVSDKRISDLWDTIFPESDHTSASQHINLGGPVFGPLMLLHTRKELSDLEILPGLYFATQKEYLEEIINNDIQPYRLYLGHSGWGQGQLQREITEGAWFIVPASVRYAFDQENDIWRIGLHVAGYNALVKVLGRHDFPEDPTLN